MKKLLTGFGVILIAALLWYLFIKPSDYTVRFEAPSFAGAINQNLKLWDQTLDTVQGIQQDGDNIYQLTQKVRFADSTHVYTWNIKPLTDSTSKVIVHVKDIDHSLMNKITLPFSDTDFEKRSRKTVLAYMENIKLHSEKFKVNVVGEVDFPTKDIAYLPLQVTQFQKAGGMMRNNSYLSGELIGEKVQLDGPPMIEVTRWDRENDSLHYNLAQPIIKSNQLPIHDEIKYKRLFGKRAIMAEYYGNYITSDRAWYAILDYAKKNGIEVEEKPIEVFYNNPNMGGNELSWKAEIYMPIKEKYE